MYLAHYIKNSLRLRALSEAGVKNCPPELPGVPRNTKKINTQSGNGYIHDNILSNQDMSDVSGSAIYLIQNFS